MPKKYNLWSLCQDITAVAFAVPTYGASMVLSPTARNLTSKIADNMNNNDDSNINSKLKEWEIKNDQWKAQQETNRLEVERLRKEREENDKKFKNNNDEIARTKAIINNPNSSKEEKSNAKKRIILLETEIKNIKAKNNRIEKDIKEKSQPTPPPSKPWIFPKLGLTSKIIIASSAVLLVYLVIDKKKKEKSGKNP